MRPVKTLMRKQSGIALVTTLLLLLLMSAMVVGFILLVTEGQRLSGMDNDQVRAFYGAESGMEKLTADLGTLFGTTYAPTGPQVNALMTTPPALPSSAAVTYVDSQGNNAYLISYPKDANGNPLASFAQITSGSSPYQGMTALETPYTLTVAALTTNGAQVKLQRTTQTIGIPLFQFGIFSQTDLSFFPGPNFNFGGRVATNGNLFVASGGPANATPTQTTAVQLWLANPVTAVGQIIRDCLSNNNPESTSGQHPGSVEITKGSGAYQALGFGQGSETGCLGGPANTSWPSISASYNGNLRSGVKPLNLTITLLGSTSPVDIIRRPVAGENTSAPGVLGERYYSQASLRVLISDNAADITGLPCVSAGAPFNLADLALPVASWATANATALKTAMTTAGTTPLPLAASGATTGAYVAGTAGGNGYWQPSGTKIITGYIKIDAQTTYGSPCGTYKDVTQEILSLGYAGKNINPMPQSYDGNNLNPNWAGTTSAMSLGQVPALPTLPIINPSTGATATLNYQNATSLPSGAYTAASFNTGSCLDPHPNAVIRLERIRDNPSSVPVATGALKTTAPKNLPLQSTVAQVCGVDPTTKLPLAGWTPQPSDFWPNVLFDTREGYNRESQPTGTYTVAGVTTNFSNSVTLGGLMNYIELDVNNLARWFSGTIGTSGPSTQDANVAPNNFVVYISDRRGNYAPTGAFTGAWPPLSPGGHETGEYGYSDFVNPSTAAGCTFNTLDTGEDLDGTGVLYTYGAITFPPLLVDSTGSILANTLFSNTLNATVADPLCAGPNSGLPWPRTFLAFPNEGRQNPSPLFRRSVKLVNGSKIGLPTCVGGVVCGLTVATENPAYVQGDYNANSAGGGFGDPNVAASVVADAFTLLSDDWHDVNTFNAPFNTGGRPATTAYYRLGVVAGKGVSFPKPSWDTTALDGSQDFGTDGGVHNFMRYLESWSGTLNYTGSILSLYYNRQGTGLFNSGGNNYSPPQRGYTFDTNFLNPSLLPPRTPMFRDINTTGFTQLMLPTQ
jgi:hypothetical protein